MSIDALIGCGYNSDIGKATCRDTDRYNNRSLDVDTALISIVQMETVATVGSNRKAVDCMVAG